MSMLKVTIEERRKTLFPQKKGTSPRSCAGKEGSASGFPFPSHCPSARKQQLGAVQVSG